MNSHTKDQQHILLNLMETAINKLYEGSKERDSKKCFQARQDLIIYRDHLELTIGDVK